MSNICHSIDGGSNVKNPTSDRRALYVGFSTFDRTCIECRIFDFRLMADRMSKIRHSIGPASDVEYSTFDFAVDRIEKIRSNNETNRIEFATFDPTECTPLFFTSDKGITKRYFLQIIVLFLPSSLGLTPISNIK